MWENKPGCDAGSWVANEVTNGSIRIRGIGDQRNQARSRMAVNAKFAIFLRFNGQLLSLITIAVPELSYQSQFGKLQTSSIPHLTQFYYFRLAQSYLSTSSMISLHLVFPIMLRRGGYIDMSPCLLSFPLDFTFNLLQCFHYSVDVYSTFPRMLTSVCHVKLSVLSEQERGPCWFRIFTWSLLGHVPLHYHS